MQNISYFF